MSVGFSNPGGNFPDLRAIFPISGWICPTLCPTLGAKNSGQTAGLSGRCAAALVSIILSAALGESAIAGGGIQVGTLTCNASSSWGFIFGSTREVDCTFTSLGRVERHRQ